MEEVSGLLSDISFPPRLQINNTHSLGGHCYELRKIHFCLCFWTYKIQHSPGKSSQIPIQKGRTWAEMETWAKLECQGTVGCHFSQRCFRTCYLGLSSSELNSQLLMSWVLVRGACAPSFCWGIVGWVYPTEETRMSHIAPSSYGSFIIWLQTENVRKKCQEVSNTSYIIDNYRNNLKHIN